MNRGLLRNYAGLISKEVEEKANTWFDRAAKEKNLKSFLKSRISSSKAKFGKFSKHQGGAYDLLLALEIVLVCLEGLTIQAMTCLKSHTDGFELPNEIDIDQKILGHNRSVMALSLYLSEMATSVFYLVLNEKDVAARIVCRSAFEAADYFLAIQDDPSLAEAYGKSSGDFRRLWNDSLRNYKIIELREKAIKSFFNHSAEKIKEDSDFRKECFDDFSQAVHPSYDAGTAILFSAMGGPNEGEWSFLNDWMHRRVVASMVYACVLPAAIELINVGSKNENNEASQLSLKSKAPVKDFLGADAATALLHGLLLAYSIVGSHHSRFPAPSLAEE